MPPHLDYIYIEDRLKDLHDLLVDYCRGEPVTEGGADALIDKTQEIIRLCGGETPPAQESCVEAAHVVQRMITLTKLARADRSTTEGTDALLREHARRVSFHAGNAIADAGTNFFRGFRPQHSKHR